MLFNFDPNRKPPKCKLCKKLKWHHKAVTGHCPNGPKTRIGYIDFHPTNTFVLKETPVK